MLREFSHQPSFVPDIYFTEAYGKLDAAFAGGTWITISDDAGRWQMPLVLTESASGVREAVSPYGYSGVYIRPDLREGDAQRLWSQAREILRALNVVSLFLRFSSLDQHSPKVASRFDGLRVEERGTTYLVPVTDSDSMWTAMEGRSRTAIRKAHKHDLVGAVREASSSDFLSGSDFRRLYEGTMTRVDASERYFFDDDYYKQLHNRLGPALAIAEVHNLHGVVASSLVMRHRSVAHYHLSGSDPAAARNGANALLVWSMLEWCAEQGLEWCHLGGGVSDGDGLSKFKRSFGGQPAAFHIGQAVIDPTTYDRLTAVRAAEQRVTVNVLESSGYFPAYRATVRAA